VGVESSLDAELALAAETGAGSTLRVGAGWLAQALAQAPPQAAKTVTSATPHPLETPLPRKSHTTTNRERTFPLGSLFENGGPPTIRPGFMAGGPRSGTSKPARPSVAGARHSLSWANDTVPEPARPLFGTASRPARCIAPAPRIASTNDASVSAPSSATAYSVTA
jgi:hypothetical protein